MAEVKRAPTAQNRLRRIGVVNTRTGTEQTAAQRAQEFSTISSYATKLAESVQVMEANRKANLTPTRDADGKLDYAERPAFLGGAGSARYDAIYQERYLKQAGVDLNAFIRQEAINNPLNPKQLKERSANFIEQTAIAMEKDGAGDLSARFRDYGYKVADDYAAKVELAVLKKREDDFRGVALDAHTHMLEDMSAALTNGDIERANQVKNLIEQDLSNNLAGYTQRYIQDMRRFTDVVKFKGMFNSVMKSEDVSINEFDNIRAELFIGGGGKYSKKFPELFETFAEVDAGRSSGHARSYITQMISATSTIDKQTKAEIAYQDFAENPTAAQDPDGIKTERYFQERFKLSFRTPQDVMENPNAIAALRSDEGIDFMRKAGTPEFVRNIMKAVSSGQELSSFPVGSVPLAVELTMSSITNNDGTYQNKYSDAETAFALHYTGMIRSYGVEATAEAFAAARKLSLADDQTRQIIGTKLNIENPMERRPLAMVKDHLIKEFREEYGASFNPAGITDFASPFANMLLTLDEETALTKVKELYDSRYKKSKFTYGDMHHRYGPSYYFGEEGIVTDNRRLVNFNNYLVRTGVEEVKKRNPGIRNPLVGRDFSVIPHPSNNDQSGSFVLVDDVGNPFRDETNKEIIISTDAIADLTNAQIARQDAKDEAVKSRRQALRSQFRSRALAKFFKEGAALPPSLFQYGD